jgi:indole-3-glycerol phosphate synthase
LSILDNIVADTRELVVQRKRKTSIEALRQKPFFHRDTRSLETALRQEAVAFIAEAKKASPSAGIIRADYDVAEIARQYEQAGASAMSVLTEPLHFQGSLDDLLLARQAVSLPLLRKDFVVNPYQLYEARAYGADAVLLIAAVLDRQELSDLHAEADELGLSCLVEVYDTEELDKLDFGQVKVLGVNNRDLRTFKVDLGHSVRVFAQAPETVVRVSESGIRTAEDVARLQAHGVHAVLVGETFMRATRPGDMLRQLQDDLGKVPVAEARPN